MGGTRLVEEDAGGGRETSNLLMVALSQLNSIATHCMRPQTSPQLCCVVVGSISNVNLQLC